MINLPGRKDREGYRTILEEGFNLSKGSFVDVRTKVRNQRCWSVVVPRNGNYLLELLSNPDYRCKYDMDGFTPVTYFVHVRTQRAIEVRLVK